MICVKSMINKVFKKDTSCTDNPKSNKKKKPGYIIWAVCFLWLISLISIAVSVLLFYFVSEILICTGTDIIIVFVFLSGFVMLPTNLHLLYYISKGTTITRHSRVGCCPLWLSVFWIVSINAIGTILCIYRMIIGKPHINKRIITSMENYRTSNLHKRFIDNVQWSLKCCGEHSYKDWFDRAWCDNGQNFEWKPSKYHPITTVGFFKSAEVADSVPLSCCKSGSCISNYLTELGTSSIYTHGCSSYLHQLVLMSISVNVVIFILVILLQFLLLSSACKDGGNSKGTRGYDVRQLMSVNDGFHPSSESYFTDLESGDDCDEFSTNYP